MNNTCGYKPPRRARAQFIINHVKIDKLCVCVMKACGMHCSMVYAPIHAGTPTRCDLYRKYTVFCSYSYLYRPHTSLSCVCRHSCRPCTRCATCVSLFIQDTHKVCVMSLYSCTKGRPCYVCIKHDCTFTTESSASDKATYASAYSSLHYYKCPKQISKLCTCLLDGVSFTLNTTSWIHCILLQICHIYSKILI